MELFKFAIKLTVVSILAVATTIPTFLTTVPVVCGNVLLILETARNRINIKGIDIYENNIVMDTGDVYLDKVEMMIIDNKDILQPETVEATLELASKLYDLNGQEVVERLQEKSPDNSNIKLLMDNLDKGYTTPVAISKTINELYDYDVRLKNPNKLFNDKAGNYLMEVIEREEGDTIYRDYINNPNLDYRVDLKLVRSIFDDCLTDAKILNDRGLLTTETIQPSLDLYLYDIQRSDEFYDKKDWPMVSSIDDSNYVPLYFKDLLIDKVLLKSYSDNMVRLRKEDASYRVADIKATINAINENYGLQLEYKNSVYNKYIFPEIIDAIDNNPEYRKLLNEKYEDKLNNLPFKRVTSEYKEQKQQTIHRQG